MYFLFYFYFIYFLNQGRRESELAVVMKRSKVRDHKVTCRSHGVWKIPHWCKSSKVVEQLLCNATEEQDAATTPTGQNGGWWMLGLGDEVRGVRWQDMMSFDRQEKVDGHAHTVLCWSVVVVNRFNAGLQPQAVKECFWKTMDDITLTTKLRGNIK